jgi:hypothetical protein
MSRTLDDMTRINIRFVENQIARLRKHKQEAADFVVSADKEIEGYQKLLEALEARDTLAKPSLLMRDRG